MFRAQFCHMLILYLCQIALGNKFSEKICLTVLTNLFSRDAYFELLPKLKLALYGSGNLVHSKSSYGRLWPHLSNTRFNSKLKLRICNVLLLAPYFFQFHLQMLDISLHFSPFGDFYRVDGQTWATFWFNYIISCHI